MAARVDVDVVTCQFPRSAVILIAIRPGTQFDARVVDALVLAIGSAPGSLDGLAA